MASGDCVLITNGNVMSMIALGEWMCRHGEKLSKIYVTYRLPSEKSNLVGVFRMLRKSGWSYTHFKIWANKILPFLLRRRGLPASVEEFAHACGLRVPVEPVASVNTGEVVSEIRSLEVDYLVSFSATQRFKESLIESPRKGAINTHYGALPAYAGLSPYYWHLHNGESRFGVTLHRIVSKLDAGPVVEQTISEMKDAKTALGVLLRMAACVSPMLCRFFEGQTTLEEARPQPSEGRSYFRHPTRAQVREFKSNGYRMMSRDSKGRLLERVEELAQLARAASRS